MKIPQVSGINHNNAYTTALNDFSPQHTTSITFPSGSVVNDRRCSEYRIIGDDIKEDSETFGLSISPVDSINTIVGNPSVFITIQDDGDGKLC